MSFSFDNGDPLELERAKRVVTDMLKRGYALFIEDKDGKLAKVKKFDPKRAEYIIADGPLYAGDANQPTEEIPDESTPTKKTTKRRTRRVPMQNAKATGIAPTAGG
jgi:hypothetical protein